MRLTPMFCECGALVFFPMLESEEIKCRRCSSTIVDPKIHPISISKTFKRQDERLDIKVKGARISMPCPRCGNKELLYNTAQLRSGDEGQTVFYTCEHCGYKDTVQS